MKKQGRPRELTRYEFGGIYQLKNTSTGDIYLGQAQNIFQRLNDHRRNRNGHLLYRDSHLYRAIKKYGWSKFEISVIEKIDDLSILNEREIFWIEKLSPEYNMRDGGDCARGWKHTEEAKRKMSETKSKQYLGENNPFYGKTHSKEAKDKIKKSHLDKPLSEEHKEAISRGNKSILRSKKVKQIDKNTGDTIKIFDNVVCAAKELNVNKVNILCALSKKAITKTSAGFKWEYYE